MPVEIGDDFDLGDDFVGDDLIGDDDLEALLGDAYEIGARRRRGGRRGSPGGARNAGAAMQRAALMKRVQQGTLVRESLPTKSRQYVLGMDSVVTVAAGATINITAQPQVVFRPERLVISSAIATSFLLNDFKVGKNSQFASSGAVPADAFAPTAFGVMLKCDTAQISNTLTMNVTNISAGALRFLASVFGEAVE